MIGLALIPQAGIQDDEALFGSAIFHPEEAAYSVKLFNHQIPLMQMSYLGSLKSWVYTPIFRRWKPSAASVRFPALVLGAITVGLFWLLLRRVSGYRAAAIGCLLLAPTHPF
jgi:hypothetical protein